MTINPTAIDHVQITVPPEIEGQALRFYRDVLGLAQIDKPAALMSRGGCWFQLGSVQLHIAVEPGAQGGTSKRHICLLVRDLDAARAALEAAGVAIKDEPVTADGLQRFFVRDPAGNRIEIGVRP